MSGREGRIYVMMGHFPHLHLFFFYFFRSFFYLLPPTHSQPCRKTTGEIMFRVKGLWLCYYSCRGICTWELMTRNKWQSHSINTLFLPFFLILIKVGCSLNSPGSSTFNLCAMCCLLSFVLLFVALQTLAHHAPLSREFSRQGYWRGLHFLLQGIFMIQESNHHLLYWQVDSLPQCHLGSSI